FEQIRARLWTPPAAICAIRKRAQHAGERFDSGGPMRRSLGRIRHKSGEAVRHHQTGHWHLIHLEPAIEETLAQAGNTGLRLDAPTHDARRIAVSITHGVTDEYDIVPRILWECKRLNFDHPF